MPVLPLIDALIFLGWSSIMVAFILKAIDITTAYRAQVFGLNAHDFLLASGIFILFAIALAARTWVKGYEPRMLRERWRRLQDEPEPFNGWNGEHVRNGEHLRNGEHARNGEHLRAAEEARASADHAHEAGSRPARTPISNV